jgi:hypothetical protein
LLKPPAVARIASVEALGLGILGLWLLFPSTAKALGLPPLLQGTIVVLILWLASSIARTLGYSRVDRLGWIGPSVVSEILLVGSLPVLWGGARTQRYEPENPRIQKVSRSAAQALLASLALGVLLASASLVFQVITPPMTPAKFLDVLRQFPQVIVLNSVGSLWSSLPMLLLLAVGIYSLRESLTSDQKRLRAKSVCRLMVIWTAVTPLDGALRLGAGLLLLKMKPSGSDGLPFAWDLAYGLWRTLTLLTLVTILAALLAEFWMGPRSSESEAT